MTERRFCAKSLHQAFNLFLIEAVEFIQNGCQSDVAGSGINCLGHKQISNEPDGIENSAEKGQVGEC